MEEQPQGAAVGAENTPNTQERFAIQKIYTKDVSLETPNSPQIFKEQWKPNVEFEMSTQTNVVGDNVYENVLRLTVTAKIEDKTAFLIEVHQAGIFTLMNFTKERLDYMFNGFCPNILFPYARESISTLVSRGGFQQLILSPINFDVVYAQQLQARAAKQQQEQANQASTTT